MVFVIICFKHFVFCQMFCLKLILVLLVFRAHCTYLTKFDIWINVAVLMDMYIFSLTGWRLNTPLYCSRVIRWACLPFCLQLQQWHPKQFSASWLAPNGGCDRTLKPPSCVSALRMSRSCKISLHYQQEKELKDWNTENMKRCPFKLPQMWWKLFKNDL